MRFMYLLGKISISAVLLPIFISVTSNAQEIGLQLHSFRDQLAKDVPGTMAKVRKMGIKEVELFGTYGLEFPEFIKILAQNEISVVSYGGEFEQLKNFPQTLADEARSYGAKYVVIFSIPHEGDNFTPEDVDKAAAVFNAAGKVMTRNGLLLCYHPHGYEFKAYKDGTLFDYMVQKFDSRVVQFEMDVFWVKQAGQDPLALLKKYPNRFVLMHVKDRKKGAKNTDNGEADVESNVVLGTGDVGIVDVVREARKIGIQYLFVEDESSRAEEQVLKSIRFLRTVR
jgi:sugar phosphate isomerase/epimerase